MRRFVSKREIVRRLERIEALLAQPTPAPLAGQETIPAELFGETGRTPRDAHQLALEDD